MSEKHKQYLLNKLNQKIENVKQIKAFYENDNYKTCSLLVKQKIEDKLNKYNEKINFLNFVIWNFNINNED